MGWGGGAATFAALNTPQKKVILMYHYGALFYKKILDLFEKICSNYLQSL